LEVDVLYLTPESVQSLFLVERRAYAVLCSAGEYLD